MYKPTDRLQPSFLDFNQPMGLKMNPENRWVKMADRIPWDELNKGTLTLDAICARRDYLAFAKRAESTPKRKSVRRSENSLVMWQGTSVIWNSLWVAGTP